MKIRITTRIAAYSAGLILFALLLTSRAAQISRQFITRGFDSGKGLVSQSSSGTSKALRNGVEVRSGKGLLRVVALRDDVLRVREAEDGNLPEDASWAVPAQIRERAVEVTPEVLSHVVGFHTQALRVTIEPATLRLSIKDLQGNVLQEDAAGWPAEFHGKTFRVYKEMPADEHYFGLGDKMGSLDRRGQSFRLWNTDAFLFQESTDPIYKSIPFFMTMRDGRSTGVFLDNTWSTSFDFGRVERNMYSFGAEAGPIDYYVFYGPNPKQVVRTYAWLTGLPPLPPLWSLGFQQSRFSYGTEARVREIAARLRSDKIPADVLYLDIDFQKEHRPFTVDTERFPHFEQMLSDLKREKFYVVAITDLHIARIADGYPPYDSGLAGDHFVKNPDGSIYVGDVWPGPSVFPDFTQQTAREWWGTLYKDFVSEGIAGFWNDMNEPSVFHTDNLTMPNNVQHRIDEPGFRPRTASHLEIHNVYGMENSRATYDGLLKLDPNLRPFVLTRATYAGGQRYAATWTGDDTSSWNHLRLTTPMLLSLGLSGFGLSGADVGGFIGTPGPELLTRWTELATFQPIDRNHANEGSGDKEVWVHGPEQEAIRRSYIEERYRLMPYIYTLVEELSRTGLPIVRPLFLEFPTANNLKPLDIDAGNEFLFGPDLLVAPPPFPEQPDMYKINLPPGIWYDYWTGQRIQRSAKTRNEESTSLVIQPKLETLPVYVREGTILPSQPLVQNTEETPQGPLTLRVYPGKDCKGSLYMDDGKTLAYTRGEFLRVAFSCEMTSSGIMLHVGERHGTYQPWWSRIRVEVYGWDSPNAGINLRGKPSQPLASIDQAKHMLSLEFNDENHGSELEIRASK